MTLRIAYFLLVMISTSALAQEESLFDRINGVTFTNTIYLKWDVSSAKGKLVYRIDAEDDWHDIEDDVIFKIKNKHKNNFKIFMEFYNPLVYSIKSGVEDLDDPAYLAINEFISQLPTTGTTASPIPASPKSFVLSSGHRSTDFNQSMLLHEWIYEFATIADETFIAANVVNGDALNALITDINKVSETDNYLFNKFLSRESETGEEQFTVSGWIKNRSDKLYACKNEYDKFKVDLDLSKRIKARLEAKKTTAVEALKAIQILLTTGFDERIAKFIPAAHKDDFKKYSASTAMWLSLNYNDRFDANEKAITKFNTFLATIETFTDKFSKKMCDANKENCNNYAQEHDFKLGWKVKIMKEFQYDIVKMDKDGNQLSDSNHKGKFTVGKKLFFYPFVSTGFLYTDFSYPNYAIETTGNVNTVAKLKDTRVNTRPAVFLNSLIASWDPVYPFIQLGIATGINDVLFPAGVGLSFGKSFSISGGALLGYTKDLTELEVGQTVKDDAALKIDLTNKGLVRGYFSINYNLGNK